MRRNSVGWTRGTLLIVIGLLGNSVLWAAGHGIWEADFAQAEALARKTERPLLIHFHASWCGPCRGMESTVLNSPELQRAVTDRVVAVKVDIDQHPEVADKFSVSMLPSDCLVAPDGKILYRKEGASSKSAYVSAIESSTQRFVASRSATKVVSGGSSTAAVKKKPEITPPRQILGMDGYCPVSLWRNREWVKGDSAYGLIYLGVIFHFKGPEERDEFLVNADQYAPMLSGCDPVQFWETRRAVQGSPKYAAFYNSRLYLFENIENRVKFRENPDRYLQQKQVVQADSIENPTLR